MSLLYKCLFVAVLAASLVGEELISIPTGYAEGLPLLPVAILSVIFNFIPVPVTLFVAGVAGKHPYVDKFLDFFRREKVLRFAGKYGHWGIAFLAPVAGVYSMTVAAWVVGIEKGKIIRYSFFGLALYAAAMCLILAGGEKLWSIFR